MTCVSPILLCTSLTGPEAGQRQGGGAVGARAPGRRADGEATHGGGSAGHAQEEGGGGRGQGGQAQGRRRSDTHQFTFSTVVDTLLHVRGALKFVVVCLVRSCFNPGLPMRATPSGPAPPGELKDISVAAVHVREKAVQGVALLHPAVVCVCV